MISLQILIGLDAYHKKTGNCYNCITPSNILFDENYDVKVILNKKIININFNLIIISVKVYVFYVIN
jgi:hypothetical protein